YVRLCEFFFFFFQAEDGIRDFHVTGVQTCALPISAKVIGVTLQGTRAHAHDLGRLCLGEVEIEPQGQRLPLPCWQEPDGGEHLRSEERRVGKECRCGW